MKLLPQRVKDCPVVSDPEQLIRGGYPVRVGVLGIPKYGVGEPDQADHVANGVREGRREREGERERHNQPLNSVGFLENESGSFT